MQDVYIWEKERSQVKGKKNILLHTLISHKNFIISVTTFLKFFALSLSLVLRHLSPLNFFLHISWHLFNAWMSAIWHNQLLASYSFRWNVFLFIYFFFRWCTATSKTKRRMSVCWKLFLRIYYFKLKSFSCSSLWYFIISHLMPFFLWRAKMWLCNRNKSSSTMCQVCLFLSLFHYFSFFLTLNDLKNWERNEWEIFFSITKCVLFHNIIRICIYDFKEMENLFEQKKNKIKAEELHCQVFMQKKIKIKEIFFLENMHASWTDN